MKQASPDDVSSWPVHERAGRRAAAPIVSRAFLWAPSTIALTVGLTLVAFVPMALVVPRSQWILLVPIAALACYAIDVTGTWFATRYARTPPGARWWVFHDVDRRAAVLTKPGKGQTRVFNLSAVPKNKKAAKKLMRYLDAHIDEPVRGSALPSNAKVYTERWGCTDLGTGRWPWKEIEFTFPQENEHGDQQ